MVKRTRKQTKRRAARRRATIGKISGIASAIAAVAGTAAASRKYCRARNEIKQTQLAHARGEFNPEHVAARFPDLWNTVPPYKPVQLPRPYDDHSFSGMRTRWR